MPRPSAGGGRWCASLASAEVRQILLGGLLLLPLPLPVELHEVRLTGNRFAPRVIEARAGDTVRFINGNGGPHNVEFVADSIAAPAQRLLEQALPGDKIGPLSGPLLLSAGERYEVIVPALPPGRYPFVCLPHMIGDMRGTLVVLP